MYNMTLDEMLLLGKACLYSKDRSLIMTDKDKIVVYKLFSKIADGEYSIDTQSYEELKLIEDFYLESINE